MENSLFGLTAPVPEELKPTSPAFQDASKILHTFNVELHFPCQCLRHCKSSQVQFREVTKNNSDFVKYKFIMLVL